MQAPTPIIIVTKGRHDMLAMTLASLYTLLSPTSGRFHIYHAWQDTDASGAPHSPYQESYACRQAWEAVRSLSGVFYTEAYMSGSVAACRAELIRFALNKNPGRPQPESVLMFDGDCLFHGNPLHLSIKDNRGVTGWSHVDLDNTRGFADYDGGIMRDTNDYLDKYGHLPFCEHPSPFHMYALPQNMHHVSTQAAWSVEALTKVGDDGKSVLDVWSEWPKGVRSYDVEGCRRIAALGYPIKILDCATYTTNLYNLPDAVEGDWLIDQAHPGKVI